MFADAKSEKKNIKFCQRGTISKRKQELESGLREFSTVFKMDVRTRDCDDVAYVPGTSGPTCCLLSQVSIP